LVPSVFHPRLYLTTETLLDYLLSLNLARKTLLELGCGSGAISLYLAKYKEVDMHSSDINPLAVSGLIANIDQLQLNVKTYQSDLFDNIPNVKFDTIIINPPFFDNPIESVDQYAFNTGKDFLYFKNLSAQLLIRKATIGDTYLILTNKCKLEAILSHFPQEYFSINLKIKKKCFGETHLIYQMRIKKSDNF